MRPHPDPERILDPGSGLWTVDALSTTRIDLLLRGGRASDLERAATRLHTATRPGRRLVRLDGKTTGRERAALQRISLDVAWEDASDGSLVVADIFGLALAAQLRLAELIEEPPPQRPGLIGLVVDDARRAGTPVARALFDGLLLIDLPALPAHQPVLREAIGALEAGETVDLEALCHHSAQSAETVAIARTLRQLGGDQAVAAQRLGISQQALADRLQREAEPLSEAPGQTFSPAGETRFPGNAPRRRGESPTALPKGGDPQ